MIKYSVKVTLELIEWDENCDAGQKTLVDREDYINLETHVHSVAETKFEEMIDKYLLCSQNFQ